MLNLSHKKLDVYQISLNLIKEVYKSTRQFPKEEQFVLIHRYDGQLFLPPVILQKGLPEYPKQKRRDFMKYPEVQQLSWIHNLK